MRQDIVFLGWRILTFSDSLGTCSVHRCAVWSNQIVDFRLSSLRLLPLYARYIVDQPIRSNPFSLSLLTRRIPSALYPLSGTAQRVPCLFLSIPRILFLTAPNAAPHLSHFLDETGWLRLSWSDFDNFYPYFDSQSLSCVPFRFGPPRGYILVYYKELPTIFFSIVSPTLSLFSFFWFLLS